MVESWKKLKTSNLFSSVIVSSNRNILSSTANATLCLNFNNNFGVQSIHLLFGIDVAKPFLEMLCENQTLDLLRLP